MQLLKPTIFLAAALITSITATPTSESVAPIPALNDASKASSEVGCYQQGTPRKPAICAKPNCPGGYRSVFWDFGCPDGTWKCCI